MSALHVRAQTVVTEDDSVAFLAFLLWLAALVYIGLMTRSTTYSLTTLDGITSASLGVYLYL